MRFVLAVAAVVLLMSSPSGRSPESFRVAGQRAAATLTGVYYAGSGGWRACNLAGCPVGDRDWGADSLTYALALRAEATGSPRLRGMLRALAVRAHSYGPPCRRVRGCHGWSDTPEWDAVALLDEYRVTGDRLALRKAEAAFGWVQRSRVFALGACPAVPFQQPGGRRNRLKTLETEANAVKAAVLLYRATSERRYLRAALSGYAAARRYFLDPRVALYSTYVFDDGNRCRQLPHRFFASVNGDMIWSGVALSHDTGRQSFLTQAMDTASAVQRYLSDGRGVFVDLQAENDVVEPLVEGMDALARQGDRLARRWLLVNAATGLSARAGDGSFGRFFDGPPPTTTVTAWQTNGGLALEIAAAALATNMPVSSANPWAGARQYERQISSLPASLRFYGSGIALFGTLGERCCEAGHARVLIDGRPTFDYTGIWQNKSSLGRSIPNATLFAWRWRHAHAHTLTFLPGTPNGKEGGSFLHLVAYEVLP